MWDLTRHNQSQTTDKIKNKFVPKNGDISVIWSYFGYKMSYANQKTVLSNLLMRNLGAILGFNL